MQHRQLAGRQVAAQANQTGRRTSAGQASANCSPRKGIAKVAGYLGSQLPLFAAFEQDLNVQESIPGTGQEPGRAA